MRNFGLLALALVAVLLAAGQLARASSQARLPIVAPLDWLPVWSPNGGEIAFTRISGRTFTLYVLDVGRHKTYRIAANQGQLSPSWSTDGRLAYSSGGGQIWIANADGTNKVRAGRGYGPAWRPGTSELAWEAADLFVEGRPWARRIIGRPAWSPDGTQLAFRRDDGIYVTTGPNAERKLSATVSEPGDPVWSPDGKQLAYTAENQVWVAAADGSSAPRALTSTFGILSTPSWSREDDAVTFTGNRVVWVAYLDGHTVKLIGGAGTGAVFSPVADTVAFSGARNGCAGHAAIRIYYDNEFNGAVTGSCTIAGTPGNDVIDGTTPGGDVIVAGAGNDTIHANNRHRDTVNCGPGRDVVFADRSDVLRRCEIVHR